MAAQKLGKTRTERAVERSRASRGHDALKMQRKAERKMARQFKGKVLA